MPHWNGVTGFDIAFFARAPAPAAQHRFDTPPLLVIAGLARERRRPLPIGLRILSSAGLIHVEIFGGVKPDCLKSAKNQRCCRGVVGIDFLAASGLKNVGSGNADVYL
jgi:hypothetical protein